MKNNPRWKETIICLTCGNVAPKYVRDFCDIRKFCNVKCYIAYKNRGEETTGNKSYNWKGDNAKHAAKHHWIRLHYGKASRCENKDCTGISKSYEWSNFDHKYKRIRSHWQMLCQSCHNNYDYEKFGIRNKFYTGITQRDYGLGRNCITRRNPS